MSDDDWIDKWKEDAIGYPKPSKWDSFKQKAKKNSKLLKWVIPIIITIIFGFVSVYFTYYPPHH